MAGTGRAAAAARASDRRRIGAALAAFALASGCGFDPRPEAPEGGPELPPIALAQAVFESYAGERREVAVRARSARIDPRTRIAGLEEVEIEFAGGLGPPLRVRSARGEFDLERDDFALAGGVEGATAGGARFRTRELRYVEASGQLVGESPVWLRNGRMTLRAGGMRVDVAGQRVRLTGEVVAELGAG